MKGKMCSIYGNTFGYIHHSIQTKEFNFMFKLLKSRKIDTKCNKTHTLLLQKYYFYCHLKIISDQNTFCNLHDRKERADAGVTSSMG